MKNTKKRQGGRYILKCSRTAQNQVVDLIARKECSVRDVSEKQREPPMERQFS